MSHLMIGRRVFLNLTLYHNYVTRGRLSISGYFAVHIGSRHFQRSIGHRTARLLAGIGVPCNLGWHPDWAKENGWAEHRCECRVCMRQDEEVTS